MAAACSLLFSLSHMANCQSSNLSSGPSAGRGEVQRKPIPGTSAAGGGECCALLPRVELMAVKLINGDESSEAGSHFIPPGLHRLKMLCVTTCTLSWIRFPLISPKYIAVTLVDCILMLTVYV